MSAAADPARVVGIGASKREARARSLPVLVAGATSACLVAVCAASVWAAGSPLRAGAPGGHAAAFSRLSGRVA
jgi:hypothetical protein